MSELSTEVKKILQRVDEIDRKRAALWRRRERLIMRLERLASEEETPLAATRGKPQTKNAWSIYG
jgi:hypothetical protein